MPTVTALRKHHLDKRADRLIEYGAGKDDDLLTTQQVADWLTVSIQWLEIGRVNNYGPRFVRLAPRNIRYRRSDVRRWLQSRVHASTSEYSASRRTA
jgi:predicted DNA-binding transcriptional regulator AlpA